MYAETKHKILRSWNSYFRYDPIYDGALERKFFGNIYIKPLEPLVNGGSFSLLGIRARKFLYEPFEEDKAWILAAAPGDEDDLPYLLGQQIDKAKELGIKQIHYSNFSPGYFYPGIDKERYPEVYNSLKTSGFREDSIALAMDAEIWGNLYDEKKGDETEIDTLKEEQIPGFLEFVENNFPADCFLRANGVIAEGNLGQITVAKVNGKFAGYAMFAAGEGPLEYAPGERFGCFEVSETYRSMGIGTKLLVRTLNSMKANGIRHAYFLWTSEKASHLYLRYGFKITRQFSIMVLDL